MVPMVHTHAAAAVHLWITSANGMDVWSIFTQFCIICTDFLRLALSIMHDCLCAQMCLHGKYWVLFAPELATGSPA